LLCFRWGSLSYFMPLQPLSHACADRHLLDCQYIMGELPLPSSLPSQGRRRSLKRRIISKAGFFFHGVAMSFVDPPSSDRARKQSRRSNFLGCHSTRRVLFFFQKTFQKMLGFAQVSTDEITSSTSPHRSSV
jgi:hypothetical protein